jgi:hypothetical protein
MASGLSTRFGVLPVTIERLVVAVAILLGSAGSCLAEPSSPAAEPQSGTEFLQDCERMVRVGQKDLTLGIVDNFKAGSCFGAVRTLLRLGPLLSEPYQFCAPKLPIAQAAQVLLQFLNENKERIDHGPVEGSAIAAFQRAWPCK